MIIIDATMFRAMIRSGAIDLQRHSEEVNNLNVFPVPDGDTGLNMFATLRGGVEAVESLQGGSLGETCKALSRGMLLAARGNSGVILSQFFAGLADGLSNLEQANVMQFAQAFEAGVKRAYEVVVKPVEGTILTVMREGGEYALSHIDSASSFEDYFTLLINTMRSTLLATPELLPVLKEAGVIDSGGAGLLYIVEGMGQALGGKIIEDVSLGFSSHHNDAPDFSLAGFDENSTLDYGYCTEFILQLTHDKGGVDSFCLDKAIDYLETLGDSLVAFQDGTLVKVHVHTKCPDKAIAYALQFGEFVRFKMENMTLQHHQTLIEKSKNISMVAKTEAPRREVAVVAVVPTEECADTFREYGVEFFVNGGSFMNPGTDEFLQAFRKANAEHIIVFPNNKNEILVAELAAKEYEEGEVHIVPTADIAQGLSCCSVMDAFDLGYEDNLSRAKSALSQSHTFSCFRAVRSSKSYGLGIKEGDYLYQDDQGQFHIGSGLVDCFKQYYTSTGNNHALLIVLASNRISDAMKEEIEALAQSEDEFMEVQFFDIGDTLYDMYAILD